MPHTDIKINYYLRQQKSIERRMFCHLFHYVNRAFNLHEYQYIGMGAKYFVDFLLFHREFGFQKMISIEADGQNAEKYDFNKPLDCIKMEYGHSGDVLPRLDWTSPTRSIVWLDYDSKLSKFMLEDVETVIANLVSGSMFFISFNSEWENAPEKRIEAFKKNLEDFFPSSLSSQAFSGASKYKTQALPVNNTIDNAVRTRSMAYEQLVHFVYKDGCEMTTIGGIVLNNEDMQKYEALDFSHLDFVRNERDGKAFCLRIPPLTYKEAIKIFEKLPCDDLSAIQIPGLRAEHIEQISKVYRYYPFYLETSIFT